MLIFNSLPTLYKFTALTLYRPLVSVVLTICEVARMSIRYGLNVNVTEKYRSKSASMELWVRVLETV